jgi:hypothetical protein
VRRLFMVKGKARVDEFLGWLRRELRDARSGNHWRNIATTLI